MKNEAVGCRLKAVARGRKTISSRMRSRFLPTAYSLRSTALALALLATNAHALTIDYDPLRAAELRACDEHRYRGREDAAQECYTELFVASRNDSLRAQAVWAMGDLAAANVLFRQYLRINPNAVLPRIAWGRLFLETHQHDEALKLFREALNSDATNAQAKLGMAQVFAQRFEGQARALVADVLKQNAD